MWRWLLAVFIIVLIVNALTPWFQRIGFGRLPGDVNFTLFGRRIHLPFMSTILLSVAAALIARLI